MNPVTLTIRQTTDSSWTTVPVRNGALREGADVREGGKCPVPAAGAAES